MSSLKFSSGLLLVSGLMLTVAGYAEQGGETATLEEVVITAQKRTERLADVPVAASVVSGSLLQQVGATDISDLNKLVPSVNLNGSFNGRVPLGIRGISTVVGEGVVGFSSGVAIMIDGVPVPSDSVAANQLEDVDQIEVLKGPQGTLGGRSAASGVINMVTRGPRREWGASFGALVTSDRERRANAFLTGPLGEHLAFSVSAFGSHVDFPITNQAFDSKSHQRAAGLRAKLLYQPTENLDVTLAARLARSESVGGNFVYSYVTPGATLLFPGSPLTQAKLLPGITPSLDNQDYNSPVRDAGAQIHDADATLTVAYRLGDYTLSSTTAYQRETQQNRQDLFAIAEYFWQDLTGGFAPPFYNIQVQNETNRQTSEELKFTSAPERPVSFVSGLFYSRTVIDQSVARDLIPASQHLRVIPDTSTYDAYGRVTWKVTPRTSLLTGLRINHDRIAYTYDQIDYTPQVAHYSSGSTESTTLVGDLGLQQRLSGDAMVYGTYSRGYSPQAYNTSFVLSSNAPLSPVGAEQVDSFEIGYKGQMLDKRLSLNLALFDTLYSNYQIETFQSLPGYVSPPTVLTSAGKAETRGLELDSAYAFSGGFSATFNFAWVDASWIHYRDDLCYGGQTAAQGCVTDPVTNISTQDARGQRMPNSPRVKFNLGLQQTLKPGGGAWDVTFDAYYSYRSSAQMLPDLNPHAVAPAFGILNLGATARTGSERYSTRLFVNNVFDRRYAVDLEDFWSSVWAGTNTVIAQPARDSRRYAGLRLDVAL